MVSVKTLHHYDKIGLIHPHYIDEWTGYRYCVESQISAMLLISRLKRYGFSLSEIKSILSERDERVLAVKLEVQKQKLQENISDTMQIINELEWHLQDFERTGDIMGYQNNYEITVEETKEIPILSTRQEMSVDDYGKYYGVLYEKAARDHISTNAMVMAIYHDKEFNHECNDTELALGVADKGQATRILSGGLCAVTVHYGGYSSLSDAYGALTKWVQANDYEIISSPYELYVKTQFDKIPPEKWETKIFFPVKKQC